MPTYQAVKGFGLWQRRLFRVETTCTWALRRACREYLGWRLSARMRYMQIGSNSFQVVAPSGFVVMEVYLDATG